MIQALPEESMEPVSQDISFSFLNQCVVLLLKPVSAVRLKNLIDCQVYACAVSGAIQIDNCRKCQFFLSSRQIRVHDSCNLAMYLDVRSRPIIEQSSGISVAPFQVCYENSCEHRTLAKLDYGDNHWASVEDFSWLKLRKSPNWTVLPEYERRVLSSPFDLVERSEGHLQSLKDSVKSSLA